MEFRDIPETKGKYSISIGGLVKNNKTNRIINTYENSKGYLRAELRVEVGIRTRIFVHRAVMYAWGTVSTDIINHRDGNRKNNHISNLEYTTYSGNSLHASKLGLIKKGESHPFSKLTKEDVIEMKRLRRDLGHTYNEISSLFNVDTKTAWNAIKGKTWKHI
jgi:hypothetical protein